jgi:L-arabinose isomerase
LALVVSLEPGPATLCALTLGPEQRWRLVVSAMTVLDFGPLPALEVPHWRMQPAGDVRDFLTAYAQAGGPHHCAVCFGDARPRLRRVAEIIGADYREV